MNPVPSGALAQAPVEMTRKRLWFLYQLAGCIKAEIEAITGWKRGQIDYALRKWHLVMFGSESYWTTNGPVDRAVARYLGIDAASIATLEQSIDLRHALQGKLRDALHAGPVDWNAIDEFPWPEEVA